MAPSLEATEIKQGKVLGIMQVIVAIVGIVGSLAVPALIWAGGVNNTVMNLQRQRDQDRRETREDLKGIRDDVHRMSDKLDAVLERNR